MTRADFIERYGVKSKDRERYQKALRAEVAGGALVLDLLLLVHQMRDRAGAEEARRLIVIEDRLQGIRDAMVVDIQRRYGMGRATPDSGAD